MLGCRGTGRQSCTTAPFIGHVYLLLPDEAGVHDHFCATPLAGRWGVMPPQHRMPGDLIVDVDAAIRDATRNVLEDEGYPTSVARTWSDARSSLRDQPRACVILFDISTLRPQTVPKLR